MTAIYTLQRIGWIALASAVLAGCGSPSEQEPAGRAEPVARPHFADITVAAGVDFSQVSGSPEQRFILESMSGGAAWLDGDGDGDLDLFLVNGSREGSSFAAESNRYFRNRGTAAGPRFAEATKEAGLEEAGWGMGCAAADYDNDGDVDLYVTYWGENLLYQNDGQGHFAKVDAGVAEPRWSVSAAFGDVDGDGWLDLYVTNYLEFDPANPPGGGEPCTAWKGLEVFCGPQGMMAQADRLYRNGGGAFADVSAATGVDQPLFPGLGVVFGDFDADGDEDIYVANDSQPNLLWRNDGDWQLSEVGALAGVAYSEDGRPQAGMGLAIGDYDNDGDEDLYVTNFSADVNTLYRNRGDGIFADGTAAVGLDGLVRRYLGWSTGFVDFDNDGWLDLFVANGHLFPQLAKTPSGLDYPQRNLLYWNRAGRYQLAGPTAGLAAVQVSRGAAFGDFDNDGDSDVVVVNLNDKAQLLENVGGNRHHWLGLELEAAEGNREAVGARVEVHSGAAVQVRWVRRAYGYGASNDRRLVFGMGSKSQVDSVIVGWPSGRRQRVAEVGLGQYALVREGQGQIAARYGGGGAEAAPVLSTVDEEVALPAAALPEEGAEALYRRGIELYQQGRYSGAEAALRAAVVKEPEFDEALEALGTTLYSGLGLGQEAATVLEQAAALDSTRPSLYELLGAVYLSLDRPAAAVAALERAAARAPAEWTYYNRLGLAYQRLEDWPAAEQAFRRAVDLAPWADQPQLNLARLYQRLGKADRQQEALAKYNVLAPVKRRVAYFRSRIVQYPRDSAAYFELAQLLLAQGRIDSAQFYFQGAVAADPQHGRAYYGLGAILHLQKQLPEATAAYQRAAELNPEMDGIFNDLGQAYYSGGRYKEAAAAFEKALERRLDSAGTRGRLGLAYAAQGRLPAAIAAYKATLAADPDQVLFLDALGRAYAAQGQFAAAIEQWDAVLRLEPANAEARRWRQQIQRKLAEAE